MKVDKNKIIVGVVGAGTMGIGIAQVAATAGFRTLLFDIAPEQTKKAKAMLWQTLEKLAEKGKFSAEEIDNIKSNLLFINELSAISESTIVVEAIVEKLAVKFELFKNWCFA